MGCQPHYEPMLGYKLPLPLLPLSDCFGQYAADREQYGDQKLGIPEASDLMPTVTSA